MTERNGRAGLYEEPATLMDSPHTCTHVVTTHIKESNLLVDYAQGFVLGGYLYCKRASFVAAIIQ